MVGRTSGAPPTRALVALALLCALLVLPAAAPRNERARRAAQRARDVIRNGSPSAVQLALSDLRAQDDPITVDLLLDVLEDDRPALRELTRSVLASFDDPDTLVHLITEGLGHRSALVRRQVLLTLGDARPTVLDWEVAARASLDDEDAGVRAAAVEALGRARATESLDRLLELAHDPSERVRAVVPEALVRLVGRRALPVLRDLSADPRWRVRLGVLHAAADLKSRRGVGLLVDMLETEQGRLREDILTVLPRLTGEHFGLRLDLWRAFLADAPSDFLVQADLEAIEPEVVASVARYYGVSTLSTRFTFITDLSASMDTLELGRAYRPQQTRLELTQGELQTLIEQLDPEVAFNLVTFSDGVQVWKPHPVFAHAGVRRSALSVVRGYDAAGSTNVFGALSRVFDQAEEALDSPREADAAADTVFLLSDGAPSAGDLVDTALLLRYAAERNRELKLRIHCIALTSDRDSQLFLRRLAEQTGGQFVSPVS